MQFYMKFKIQTTKQPKQPKQPKQKGKSFIFTVAQTAQKQGL